MIKHPLPAEALKAYRRMSPDFVNEQAQAFLKLSHDEQIELLFFMSVHQANALGKLCASEDMELVEVEPVRDN